MAIALEFQQERHIRNMRLKLILPVIEPGKYENLATCPRIGCKGQRFLIFQEVQKNLRDNVYREVIVRRYKCLSCGHTFRVYPRGVSRGQVSQRVKGMAVMLYLLGLSYGAVVLMLEALGIYLGKSSVYRSVQQAGEAVRGLKREELPPGYRDGVIGGRSTSVRCHGEWLTLGVAVDPLNGCVLSIDDLAAETRKRCRSGLNRSLRPSGRMFW